MSQVVYQGYLVKQGHVRKNWKRRYFVLTEPQDLPGGESSGSVLNYYESEFDFEKKRKLLGSILVRGSYIRTFAEGDFEQANKFPFAVTLELNNQLYILVADSEMEQQRWMKALATQGAMIPRLEGLLEKRHGFGKDFKLRWCVLYSDVQYLHYFKTRSTLELRGFVPLRESLLVRKLGVDNSFTITCKTMPSNNVYEFKAEHQQGAQNWVDAFIESGCGSVKKMAIGKTHEEEPAEVDPETRPLFKAMKALNTGKEGFEAFPGAKHEDDED